MMFVDHAGTSADSDSDGVATYHFVARAKHGTLGGLRALQMLSEVLTEGGGATLTYQLRGGGPAGCVRTVSCLLSAGRNARLLQSRRFRVVGAASCPISQGETPGFCSRARLLQSRQYTLVGAASCPIFAGSDARLLQYHVQAQTLVGSSNFPISIFAGLGFRLVRRRPRSAWSG